MTPPLDPHLKDHVVRYGESHGNAINQALHFVGIPSLLVSSLGALARRRVSPAWVFAAAAVYYGRWDHRIAGPLGTLYAASYAVGSRLSTRQLRRLFAAGVITHLVGHYIFEGKPPALFTRPVAVLEAPAWFLANLLKLASRRGRPRLHEARASLLTRREPGV